MKTSRYISEDKLVRQAIDILLDKLGPVETNRFLSLPVKKRMESVKRHQSWQSKLNQKTFFNEIFSA